MAHKCPACSAEVPGVVTSDILENRLSAKSTEIKMLRDELGVSKSKADRFDTAESERLRLSNENVELREGASLTLEELVSHLEANDVSKETFPERLEVVDALPRGSGGKVAKQQLRDDIRRKLEG